MVGTAKINIEFKGVNMSHELKKPPRFAKWLLYRSLDEADRDSVMGDFEEFYSERMRETGSFGPRCWYWWQAVKSIPHFIRNSIFWRFIMFRNYFNIAIRNMKKHKGYTFINIVGLSVGMACCIILFLYITHELAFDHHHRDSDRIYRILEYRKVPAGEFLSAGIAAVVGEVIKKDYPQVESMARVFPTRNALVHTQDMRFFEDRMVYTDPELFDVLTVPFVLGNSETALREPHHMVITERMAHKYFGEESPIGKRLSIKDPVWNRIMQNSEEKDFVITGVIQNCPDNTHLKFDALLPLNVFKNTFFFGEWHMGGSYTYIKLASDVDLQTFSEQIKELAYQYVSRDFKAWGQTRYYKLQPLLDIHFQDQIDGLRIRDELEPSGNIQYLYVYSIIGFLVLLIGCMNFINLSNSRSIFRMREVGLRKVVGAQRHQLAYQFLGESILVTLLAAVLAFVLIRLLLPHFNSMAGTQLSVAGLIQPEVIILITGLVAFVGIVAGGYPAWILSLAKPALTVKGSTTPGSHGSTLLKILVTGQFTISIFLAIGTVTVYQQLHFMRSGALGFDKTQKIVIPFRRNQNIRKNWRALKNEFVKHPYILGGSASSTVPGQGVRRGYLKYSDDKLDKPWSLKFISCDHDFISQYDIGIVAGRSFRDEKSDEVNAFLINEAAVKLLGFRTPEQAIGERLHEGYYGRWKTIIGVIRNFHYQGMQHRVEPLFMEYSTSRFDALTLTISTENLKGTLAFIESKWRELYPIFPYEGYFLDVVFDRQYRKEAQIGKMLTIVTTMGLVIASLGLLGLAAFIAQRRTKEIGIRKVLGAGVPSIVILLSKRFIIVVFVSSVIACPAAYYALSQWLQDFAHRISMNWITFLLPSISALLVALLTVCSQAWRASRTNPVEVLKYE